MTFTLSAREPVWRICQGHSSHLYILTRAIIGNQRNKQRMDPQTFSMYSYPGKRQQVSLGRDWRTVYYIYLKWHYMSFFKGIQSLFLLLKGLWTYLDLETGGEIGIFHCGCWNQPSVLQLSVFFIRRIEQHSFQSALLLETSWSISPCHKSLQVKVSWMPLRPSCQLQPFSIKCLLPLVLSAAMWFLPFQNPIIPVNNRKPSFMVISLSVNLAFRDASVPLTSEITIALVNEPSSVSSKSTE